MVVFVLAVLHIDFHFDLESLPPPDHPMPHRPADSCQLQHPDPQWRLYEFPPLHRNILPRLHLQSHINRLDHLNPPLVMALVTFGRVGPGAGLDAALVRQLAATCHSSGAARADDSL